MEVKIAALKVWAALFREADCLHQTPFSSSAEHSLLKNLSVNAEGTLRRVRAWTWVLCRETGNLFRGRTFSPLSLSLSLFLPPSLSLSIRQLESLKRKRLVWEEEDRGTGELAGVLLCYSHTHIANHLQHLPATPLLLSASSTNALPFTLFIHSIS